MLVMFVFFFSSIVLSLINLYLSHVYRYPCKKDVVDVFFLKGVHRELYLNT